MESKKYKITEAELEIMKVLWEKESQTLNQIVKTLSQEGSKNKSSIKTLVYRLVEKGSVSSIEKAGRENEFFANITQEEYLKKENESFLKRLYHGSTNQLLLNFVEEKKITKKDLQDLMDMIESEEE